MKRVVWVLCAVIAVTNSYSQPLQKPLTASYTGMGAYSLSHVDAFSFSSNQSSLSRIKNTEAGIYAERKFFLAALNNYRAVLAMTTPAGNFGFKMNHYGVSNYRETQLGLAHGRKLGDKLDIGIQLNYNNINLAAYGRASAITAECGMILHINEQLHTAIHINNPVGGSFGKDHKDKLPAVITAGIGYEASSLFFINAEIIKEEDQPVNVNIGIQYQLIPQLYTRAGISTGNSSLWIGVGFSWKKIRLDIINNYHPQLGITPGLLILFRFASKSSKTDEDNI